jgi:hypothetical protein
MFPPTALCVPLPYARLPAEVLSTGVSPAVVPLFDEEMIQQSAN